MPTLDATVRIDNRDVSWKSCEWPAVARRLVNNRLDIGFGTISVDHAVLVEQAGDYYSIALQNNPRSAEAFLLQGLAAQNRRDYDRAAEFFTRAHQVAPDQPAPLCWRAQSHWKKGNMQQALQDVEHALRVAPKYSEALYTRGILRLESDQAAGALADLSQVIATKPSPLAYVHRGIAYAMLKDAQRAKQDFDEAIRQNPNLAYAYESRGDLLSTQKQYAQAVQDYSRALALTPPSEEDSPDTGRVRMELAWLLAVSPDPKVLNGRRALELATQVCKADAGKTPRYLLVLAAAQARVGKYAEAIRSVEQAKAAPGADPELAKDAQGMLEAFRDKEPAVLLDP
jgi:tetratricopeptide (TPR) repeat protein